MYESQREVTPICNHRVGVRNGRVLFNRYIESDLLECYEMDSLYFGTIFDFDEWFGSYIEAYAHCPDCGHKISWEMSKNIVKSHIVALQNKIRGKL